MLTEKLKIAAEEMERCNPKNINRDPALANRQVGPQPAQARCGRRNSQR